MFYVKKVLKIKIGKKPAVTYKKGGLHMIKILQ